jgi:uncharacterized protein
MQNLKSWIAFSLLCLSVLVAGQAMAASDSSKPFAEHRIVLQISDPNPFKQTLVLNVANNLLKAYGGPDKVDIEIVAFGPGLRLLFADNTGRIQGLADNGVRFAACNNTLTNMTKILGSKPALNKHAVVVSAGVVRIIELVDEGYTLVKP